jgi:rhodanese-related sulfurtransferase
MRLQKFFWILLMISGTLTACITNAQQPKNLPVVEFEKGIKQPGVQVLDVRTPGEYKSGYIKNALLADWMNQADFVKNVQSLDKSKPVYTYCLVGGRSGEAAKWLTKKGYTVYNLEGGMTAWKKAGKPVTNN